MYSAMPSFRKCRLSTAGSMLTISWAISMRTLPLTISSKWSEGSVSKKQINERRRRELKSRLSKGYRSSLLKKSIARSRAASWSHHAAQCVAIISNLRLRVCSCRVGTSIILTVSNLGSSKTILAQSVVSICLLKMPKRLQIYETIFLENFSPKNDSN